MGGSSEGPSQVGISSSPSASHMPKPKSSARGVGPGNGASGSKERAAAPKGEDGAFCTDRLKRLRSPSRLCSADCSTKGITLSKTNGVQGASSSEQAPGIA